MAPNTLGPEGEPVIRVAARPADTNANGDLFGGWLVSQMDLAAGIIAARHSRGRVATVAIDSMQFLMPVKVGDLVSVYGEVTRVGRTSMTITAEAWRTTWRGEEPCKVTAAVFTFVAIDKNGRPRPVDQE